MFFECLYAVYISFDMSSDNLLYLCHRNNLKSVRNMGKQNFSRVCIGFLLLSLVMNLSAKVMGYYDIPLDGEWQGVARSVTGKAPVVAAVDGNRLIVQCTSLQSDIVIRIMNDQGFFYEKMVPSAEARYVSIDLLDVPKGSYTLDLSNQGNGHLTGGFELR